jgi:hypothetical protein
MVSIDNGRGETQGKLDDKNGITRKRKSKGRQYNGQQKGE